MLFNSFHFVYFFIIVTAIYFLSPHNKRWMLLLAASCYFYMAFVPIYILILFSTIIIDYFAGIAIENAVGKKRKRNLIISLVANIGVLCFFKYYNFFNDSLSFLLKGFALSNPIPHLDILLPIGLSFHTFQAMSYTIEVYRGNQKAEKHFGTYALYVMFYPQLVAGPIERPQNLLHQFREKYEFDANRFFDGLKLMVWGLFKKLVVADRLAIYVDSAFNNYEQQSTATLLIAILFFSFQIYCDFSGYSDIAIGSARVMGFKLMTNFKRPIFARSTGEFWKRWHISLSTWFKDYLYFPLGGSKVAIPRVCFNLMIVFLISGLWHGANWTFVIWGAINGLYVVFGMLTHKFSTNFWSAIGIKKGSVISNIIHISITFFLISFSRIFFRSETFGQAVGIIKRLFSFNHPMFSVNTNMLAYSLFAIIVLVLIEMRREFMPAKFSLSYHKSFWVRNAYYAGLVLLILLVGVYDGGQFIYFQF